MVEPLLARFWEKRSRAADEAEANGWTERSQVRRFGAALATADIQEGDSVLDWGCGTGRLWDFLPDDVHYLGVDASEPMLGRARTIRPELHFCETKDFDPSPLAGAEFDFVFALGVWNVRPWLPARTTEEIEKLWKLTRKALVVSLLRTTGREESLTYDPRDVAELAAGLGGSGWVLDTSHLPNDILLTVYR